MTLIMASWSPSTSAFEGLEAAEQPNAGELGVVGWIAHEQVARRRGQRVGDLEQHLGRQRVEAVLHIYYPREEGYGSPYNLPRSRHAGQARI